MLNILNLRTRSGRDELRRQVANHGDVSAPAERLLSLIENRNYASAIVEPDYIDVDHHAALARFYRLRHRDTAARCVRVHLFESPVADVDELSQDQMDSYRGFLVLRPFSHETLGRCILSGDLCEGLQEESYVTCKASYRIHLGGREILFSGTPWMQQDRMVAACASTAMWVATWHLGHYLGGEHRVYTTPEITELSTRFSLATGRSMPSGGLTTDQMSNGFHAMGYAPLMFGEWEAPTPEQVQRTSTLMSSLVCLPC